MKCFYCGSEETVKSGHKRGKQRYFCKTCKKTFLYPRSEREREPKPLKPKLTHTEYVRQWRAKQKGLPYVPKLIFPKRPLPSIESLINVPCFGCSMQNNCNPEFCELLTNYLLEIDRKPQIIEVKQIA